MILQYVSGNGDSAVFTVTAQGKSTQYTIPDKKYMIIQVTGSVNISVPGAGQADFSNDDVCLCTRQYGTPSFYLQGITNTQLVNAWIFLDEDEPSGTNYNSPNSCYQTLIQNNIYQSVNILYICFVATTPTSANTIPAGNGSSYTIEIGAASHQGGLTNQDYMNNVIRDARKNNPNIKIAVTLNWRDGSLLSNIFPNPNDPDQLSAKNFAANLMAYLKHYDLDGFDIDWEPPISSGTTKNQFTLLINAIGAQFKQQTDKHYYLTLSPSERGNLDATAVTNNMDFVNLQLYGGASPSDFKNAGVNPDLFAYGAKFESGKQTAQGAYQDNKTNYHYSIFTNWRLNSDNYVFEQTQQQLLYQLVFPT